MSDASLTTGGTQGAAIRLERVLADPPSVVWRALTEREQLKAWFPCDVVVADGQWQAGAGISFVFGPEADGLVMKGEVVEAREPESLVFTWGEETLRFTLTPQGTGTLLVLVDELQPRHRRPQRRRLGRVPGPAGRRHAGQGRVEAPVRALHRTVLAGARRAGGPACRDGVSRTLVPAGLRPGPGRLAHVPRGPRRAPDPARRPVHGCARSPPGTPRRTSRSRSRARRTGIRPRSCIHAPAGEGRRDHQPDRGPPRSPRRALLRVLHRRRSPRHDRRLHRAQGDQTSR